MLICLLALPLLLAARTADSSWLNIDGTLKTRLEWSARTGDQRFNLRNSRIGAFGDVNKYVGYRVQVELNSEGNFAVLDGFVNIRPANNLELSVGQTAVPFENAYLITPSEILFSNRVFIGKFFTPSSRDIGVKASYRIGSAFPITLVGGVFNGGVLNDPQWTKRPSFALSVHAGSLDKFRATVKAYRYPGEENDWLFVGADLSFFKNNLLLQAEVMNRYDYDAATAATRNFTGAYLQGAYTIPYRFLALFHAIVPAIRWDAMTYDFIDRGIDVNRVTAGLSFDLTGRLRSSCLRFNFEQYFVRDEPPNLRLEEHTFDSKMTIELLLKF